MRRAQDWRWGSLFVRERGPSPLRSILSEWPLDRPADWVRRVNRPLTAREIDALELSLRRGRPFGDDPWTARTVGTLRLEHTVRREGRPGHARPTPKERRKN